MNFNQFAARKKINISAWLSNSGILTCEQLDTFCAQNNIDPPEDYPKQLLNETNTSENLQVDTEPTESVQQGGKEGHDEKASQNPLDWGIYADSNEAEALAHKKPRQRRKRRAPVGKVATKKTRPAKTTKKPDS